MASIGEVTATLKADIGQYVGPMQQAADATKAVQASVEQATTSLLKEGAAGQAAGKGLTLAGASSLDLAQQLAAAEGRVTQLQSAFAALGIQAKGAEFARATAEVARLKAELAATGQVVPNLGPALSVPLQKVGASAGAAAPKLSQLRGTITSVASSLVGVPGPLGNLASKLLMFGVGGGVTVAATAGLAAVALAFTKLREKATEESDKTKTVVDGLVDRYREATGAIARENRERTQNQLDAARKELERLSRTTLAPSVIQRRAGVTTPQIADPAALARANDEVGRLEIALNQANDELDTFNKSRNESAQPFLDAVAESNRLLAEQARVLQFDAEQLHRLHAAGVDIFAETDTGAAEQVTRHVREQAALHADMNAAVLGDEAALRRVGAIESSRVPVLQQLRALAGEVVDLTEQETAALEAGTQAALERVGLVQNAAQSQKALAGLKVDSSLKDAVRASQQDAAEATRGVASAMARAFMAAFSDQEQSITDKITSVLGAALRAAMEKLLAEKIFSGILGFLTGGGSKVAEIVGGALTAPTLAMPAMESRGTTIVVPLEGLPKPVGPIEMARDAMHMALWVETARQAQANGVNLQPRFR